MLISWRIVWQPGTGKWGMNYGHRINRLCETYDKFRVIRGYEITYEAD